MKQIRELEELRRLVEDQTLYLRFSKGPEVDRGRTSLDYESGLELPGVSVNPLNPQPWWTRPMEDWLARQICHYIHLNEEEDRFAWVLTGEICGEGPDREPLLENWEPVAILSEELLAEARKRYETNFDKDRDSRGDG